MAKEQKGFCLYFDWLDRLKDAEVPPEDIARVIYALADYCRYGTDPTVAFAGTLKFAVSLMFDQIKRAEAKAETLRANGAKRWNNEKQLNANAEQMQSNSKAKAKQNLAYNNNNNNNNNINNSNNVKEKEANASKEKADNSPPNASEEKKEKSQTDIYIERFERFWKVYPKKVGKGDARKAFVKYQPSEKLTETMIKAVEIAKKSVQWTKDGGKYIPNPSTWLNQERWEDELTAAPEAVQQQKSDVDKWFEEVYMEGRPFG